MTSAAPSLASTARRISLGQHLGAIAQLAAIGVAGIVFFTVAVTLFSIGIATALLLGIGFLFLFALVYVLWSASWLEYERTEGLYGFGIPRLHLRARTRPGFGGWVRQLGQQSTDGSMWRGVASALVATVLGLVVLSVISALVTSVTLLFAPLMRVENAELFGIPIPAEAPGAVIAGVLGLVLGSALLVGISFLQAILARALLVPSREALLAEAARAASEQRAGAVRASEVERTRIERDLHDGVQPRLVSVGMTLGLAQEKIDSDPVAAKALVAEAHTSTKAAITELRQLARGIHASVLDDRGLDAALSALAARSPIPVTLDVRLDQRCNATAEAAVYFSIAESLTNAAKHSRGSQVRVAVRRREAADSPDRAASLWARIEDDGIGSARIVPGGGLDGITNRVLAAGGTARLDSPVGGPTSLEVTVPCAS